MAWMIDDLEPVADSPSMVMDPQGGIHVAFVHGRFNGPLYYGHRPLGGSWSSEMASPYSATESTGIAVDSTGGVHIVFQTSPPDAIQYAHKPAGSDWSSEIIKTPVTIGAYQIEAITLDAMDRPHIGIEYFDTLVERGHAHRETSGWVIDVAEGSGGTPWSGPRISVFGSTIKMAYPVSTGPARYAVENAGSWSIIDLPSSAEALSLALDPSGVPHLVFDRAQPGGAVDFAYATPAPAGGWSVESAGRPGAPGTCPFRCNVAYMNSLSLDSAGGAHAVFTEVDSLNSANTMFQYLLRYVYRAPGGGWTNEYIDGLGAYAGIYNAIALDPNGGVHVIYTYMTSNTGTPALKHAYRCR